jgi:hypothetical protein
MVSYRFRGIAVRGPSQGKRSAETTGDHFSCKDNFQEICCSRKFQSHWGTPIRPDGRSWYHQRRRAWLCRRTATTPCAQPNVHATAHRFYRSSQKNPLWSQATRMDLNPRALRRVTPTHAEHVYRESLATLLPCLNQNATALHTPPAPPERGPTVTALPSPGGTATLGECADELVDEGAQVSPNNPPSACTSRVCGLEFTFLARLRSFSGGEEEIHPPLMRPQWAFGAKSQPTSR